MSNQEHNNNSQEKAVEKTVTTGSPAFGLSLSNIKDVVDMALGTEGRVHIFITNRLPEDIEIHLKGGRSKEIREVLKSGVTRVFSKKPKAGLVGQPTCYECEFWAGGKHVNAFVYGKRAPREKNHFEVKEQGIFLIEDNNGFCLYKWE